MNVLPIVFSILMLLAIMTYSQLQYLIARQTIRSEYVCFMKSNSRNQINALQEELYEEHKVKGGRKNSSNRVDAFSEVNLTYFIKEPSTDEQRQYLRAHQEIMRRLLGILYDNRPFFQEFEAKRPDALNEVWQEVVRALKDRELRGEKLKKAKELANLQLEDPELNFLWAHMLKRIQTPESLSYDCESKKGKDIQKRVEYYPNLIDYVAIYGQSEKPYRIWLAPKELLLAIFQDEGVVDQIMQTRRTMYYELKNAPKDLRSEKKRTLAEDFGGEFRSRIPSDMPLGIANFEVSLTEPKN